MTSTAIVLSLANGLAWAGLDAVRKRLSEVAGPAAIVVVITVGQAPVFAIWAAVDGGWFDGSGYLLPGLSCLVLNVVANVSFVQAVKLSPLSLTIPLLSLTPVFAALLAIPLADEVPASRDLAGIALVVVGALALHGTPKKLAAALVRERGSLLMLLVAALWSCTAVLDKLSLDHAAAPAHALVQTGGVGACLAGYLAVRRRLGELRELASRPAGVAAAAVFAIGGIALQLAAIQVAFVAAVETVKRGVGMTMSVAVGRVLFREPVTVAKVAAIVLMTAGTVLLSL